VIEFGDHYCRFISHNGSVLETALAITAITNANPGVVSVPGNPWATGDWIFITGTGVPQLDGRFFAPQVIGANLTLFDVNGDTVNTATYDVWASGGTAARVYTIVSPYAAADLQLLKFVQSASVMTITHPSYVPYNLASASPTNWNFTPITFGTSISPPTGLGSVCSAGGTTNYAFAVTAVDGFGQESLVSNVSNLAASADIYAVAETITITWTGSAGAVGYNVYMAERSYTAGIPVGAQFGFIGSCTGTTFINSKILPDFSISPPIPRNPFAGNNPISVCYFQQRLSFGGSAVDPTTFWMSQPGLFYNFNVSSPIQDDDAITGTIVSLEVNSIKSLLPMPGGLIALTSKGAWQIGSGNGAASVSAITPANATATPQAYNGASDVPPIVVNYDVIYVQAKGSTVRDLSYNIYANIYTGTDISVLSNHLFFGHSISQWAYAEEPFKTIWAVREDGILLTLTMVKDQEIFGWSHSDTLGLFKSVCAVTENQVDAVYVLVQRSISGRWVYMIERFADRTFTYSNQNREANTNLPIPYITANAESAWCVDCGIQSALSTFNGTLSADSSRGSTLFASTSTDFGTSQVGSILRMGGGIATITDYISPFQIRATWTASPSVTIPNDPNQQPSPAAPGQWSIAPKFSTLFGLDYLEGQTVSILADGGVIDPQVVTNGSITLDNPASLVTVGLGFQAQLQTMPLDINGSDGTIQGKRKSISALTVLCVNTRGLKAGSTFAEDVLVAIKELSPSTILGDPIPLITGQERVVMDPSWDVEGQICLQQDNPLPATVLGVVPEISIGDTKDTGR
jgi:hypothetical protein